MPGRGFFYVLQFLFVLYVEYALEVARSLKLCGSSAYQARIVEKGDAVAETEGDVELVSRENDAFVLFPGETGEERDELVAVGEVEERRRLVQEYDRRVLGEGARNHDALALAIAHGVHGASCESRHSYSFERACDDVAVDVLKMSYPVGVWRASESHDVLAAEVGYACALCVHEGDGAGKLLRTHFAEIPAADDDVAGVACVDAGESAQQR